MLGEYSWDFWILFGLSEKDLVFCEMMEMLNISGIFHNIIYIPWHIPWYTCGRVHVGLWLYMWYRYGGICDTVGGIDSGVIGYTYIFVHGATYCYTPCNTGTLTHVSP